MWNEAVDRDADGVGIGLRATAAAVAQVVGGDLQAGWAVVAAGRREHQAVQGVVDIGDAAVEGHGCGVAARAHSEAEPGGATERQQAIGRRQRYLDVAGAGIHVADADHIAIGTVEYQVVVLIDVLRRGHRVDRRVVHGSDHERDAGGIGLRTAAAGIAAIVDGDGQGDVGSGVAGGGEADARCRDEGIDVGKAAGQGQGAGGTADGNAVAADGTERAAGYRKRRGHVAAASIDVGERDTGQCAGHIFGDGNGAWCGDRRCVVDGCYIQRNGAINRAGTCSVPYVGVDGDVLAPVGCRGKGDSGQRCVDVAD